MILNKKRHHTEASHSVRYVSLSGNKSIRTKHKDSIVGDADGMQDAYFKRDTDPAYLEAVRLFNEDQEKWKQSFHQNFQKLISSPEETNLHSFVAFMTKNWKPTRKASHFCLPKFIIV